MKRLSKSATDLSTSCRRKSHSTSPEEEEASSRFGEEDEEDEEDEENRPRSVASAVVPYGRQSRGILTYLKERLTSRSQSTERGGSLSPKRIAKRYMKSAAATPVAKRKGECESESNGGRYQQQSTSSTVMGREEEEEEGGEGRAEIVRYRCTAHSPSLPMGSSAAAHSAKRPLGPQSEFGAHGANNNNLSQGGSRAEVVRHHVTPLTSLPAALAQELEQQSKLKRTVVMTEGPTAVVEEKSNLNGQKSSEETLKEKRHKLQSQKSVASAGGPSPSDSIDKALPPPAPQQQQQQQMSSSTSPPLASSSTQQPATAMSPQSSLTEDDDSQLSALKQHSFYLLHVPLRRGPDQVGRGSWRGRGLWGREVREGYRRCR